MGQNKAITDTHFPDESRSYVPRAALLVVWCITWNYDSSVIFMILILELGLLQLGQLWDFRHGGCHDHHKSPPGAFAHTHAHTVSSRLLSHIATDCGPVDLWCVNSTVFFMRGLDKQYLEPIDRYAVHYPICCNTFLSLPVSLARTWQNWTEDYTHRVNKTKMHTKMLVVKKTVQIFICNVLICTCSDYFWEIQYIIPVWVAKMHHKCRSVRKGSLLLLHVIAHKDLSSTCTNTH